jgi:hypothetical protein
LDNDIDVQGRACTYGHFVRINGVWEWFGEVRKVVSNPQPGFAWVCGLVCFDYYARDGTCEVCVRLYELRPVAALVPLNHCACHVFGVHAPKSTGVTGD